MLFTLITVIVQTLTGPLIFLVWLARMFFLCGGGLFLLAAPFAHQGFGIALLYFAQAVAMTLVLRFLRKLQLRYL